ALLGRLTGTGRRGPAGAGVDAGRSLPVARRRVVRGGALTVPGSGRGLAVAGRRGGLTVAGRGRRLAVAGCGGGLAVLGGRGRLVVARLVGLSRAVSGGARGQTAAGDRPGR